MKWVQIFRWSTQISSHVYPPTQNCQWQEIKSSLIYVINESPFKTDGGIRSSFQMKCTTRSTCQMKYPDKLSDIPPQNKMMCTDSRIRSSFQMKCPTRSTCHMKCSDILPLIIRWHVQTSMSFSDEVFMFHCCIGNVSSCTLSNLCRSLCVVVVVVTISCCCCPVIALVLVQLHMNSTTTTTT